MKNRTLGIFVIVLLVLIFLSCVLSEIVWLREETSSDSLRQLLGLHSITVGNMNPAARNPGLELFCTGLYDAPGGYCSYFTNGVPLINSNFVGNVTLGENSK